nr:GNAT family N-acetyltransferase [Saprospiraceae bacterium]
MADYRVKYFDELSLEELYGILRLRSEVFVVEQNCPYQDLDNLDQQSIHLWENSGDKIISYSRILQEGILYPGFCSIGRVITRQQNRGKGRGRQMMLAAIAYCEENFPCTPIKIMAQTYLIPFYQSLGFQKVGKEFLEDGIPHHYMERH